MRINLYARLARVVSAVEIDRLEDEIADRFGAPPQAVTALLAASRLSALAAEAGVTKIATGPKATVFTLSIRRAAELRQRLPEEGSRRWVEDRLVFDATGDGAHDDVFIAAVLSDLAA
jgi:transcription-repair coupling factor (superfamily II helicase)